MTPAPVQAIDSKEWTGVAASHLPELPPYPHDLPVTSCSVYGDDSWEYSRDDLPPGSRLNRFLNFFSSMRMKGTATRPSLLKTDELLTRELKDCMVAAIFRQSSIPNRRKIIVQKPGSILNFFSYARRIFISIKLAGYVSLSEVPPSFPVNAFDLIATSDKEYNKLLDVFAVILAFVDAGLIQVELDGSRFGLQRRTIVEDSSRARGAQALTDNDVATAISASRFYIDNFELITSLFDKYPDSGQSAEQLSKLLNITLPTRRKLYPHRLKMQVSSIIKIAGYNLIAWHLGARISEMLSIKRGFIHSAGDSAVLLLDCVELHLETRKAVSAVHGKVRAFSVHPYLARVSHVLTKVADLQGNRTGFIFEGPLTGDIIEVNGFNELLKRFAEDHGYCSDISSHTWRNTLVSVSVRAVAEPLGPLAYLLGHAHVSTVVSYAFSNPFVRKELRRNLAKTMSPRVDRFLDGSRHFGGDGLRGRQGSAIEANLSQRLSRGENLEAAREEIAAPLISGDMSVTSVDTGIDCIKPPLAKGPCTQGRGDILADTANCQVGCHFRAETSPARNELRKDIEAVPSRFEDPSTSTLMKVRIASDIIAKLSSWPELGTVLAAILDRAPHLWRFFEELKDE